MADLFNTLLGDTSIGGDMTEEQKKKALEFTKEPSPKPTTATQTDLGGMGNLFTGKPKLEDVLTTEGLGDRVDKAVGLTPKEKPNLLSSKESSKTIGKAQNQMQKPKPKPQEAPQERANYVELDTPEKVDKVAQETAQEITKASDSKSVWEQALGKLGMAKDIAKEKWDELENPLDRVDWLTTLTVYAASRYMGNNGGLALANGLMRGMESKSQQEKIALASKQGQLKAQQDAEQGKFNRSARERELKVSEGRLALDREKFEAPDDATKTGGTLLNKYSRADVTKGVAEALQPFNVKDEKLFGLIGDTKNAEKIRGRVESMVLEKLEDPSNQAKSIKELSQESLQELSARSKGA